MLLGLVLSTACSYTFIPLQPERQPFPQRTNVVGQLFEDGDSVVARLEVRRLSRPGYLELRWFREDKLIAERSLWAEGAGRLEARFPYQPGQYHRLLVLSEKAPQLQLDLGTPTLPKPPEEVPPGN
jgi:hypothetical protein